MGPIIVQPGKLIGAVLEYERTKQFTSIKIKHPNDFGMCWINVWTNRNRNHNHRGVLFVILRAPTSYAEGDFGEAGATKDEIALDRDAEEPDPIDDDDWGFIDYSMDKEPPEIIDEEDRFAVATMGMAMVKSRFPRKSSTSTTLRARST